MKMKKLFFYLLMLPLVVTACSSDDDDTTSASKVVTFDNKQYTVDKEGGDILVNLHNAQAVPVLDYLDDTADWIEMTQSAGGSYANDRKYYFHVAANESYESDRVGRIVFTNDLQSDTIYVYQTGGHPIMFVGSDTLRVSAIGGLAEAVVNSNFDFNCLMPSDDWVQTATPSEVRTRGVVKEHIVYFNIAPNATTTDRTAQVIYTDPASNLRDTLVILQGGQIVMDAHSITINPAAATITLTMNTAANVKVATDDSWLKPNANGTIAVEALPEDSVQREGTVTFTNQQNGVSELVTIVQRRPVIISNSQDEMLHSVGLIAQQTYQLKAATIDGQTEGISWTSSDDDVATVSEEGLVTPVANGQATITATAADGTTATCKVEVKDAREFMTFYMSGSYSVKEGTPEHNFSCSLVNHSVYQIRVTRAVINEGQKGAITRTLNQNVAVGDTVSVNGALEDIHPTFKWYFTIGRVTYNVTVSEKDSAIDKQARRKE